MYVRGESALACERVRAAIDDARRFGAIGEQHLRLGVLVRRHRAPRRRRVRRRRGERAALQPRRRARDAARPAAVPRGAGALRAADDRQQRRDAVDGAVDRAERRRRVRRARRRALDRDTRVLGLGSRASPGQLRGRAASHDVPRPDLRSRARRRRRRRPRGHSRSSRARRSRGSGPSTSISRLDIDDVAAAGSSLASGLVVLDDTVCPVRVAARLVRFFADGVVREVHAVPRGHAVAREDHVPDRARVRTAATTSRCSRTSAARMGPGTTICALGPSAVAPISVDAHAVPTTTTSRTSTTAGCPLESAGARRVASLAWQRTLGAMTPRAKEPLQRVPQEARLREHAGAGSGADAKSTARPQAPLRRAGAPRAASPLGPPARARRRALVVGGAQGHPAAEQAEPPRGPHRGPPARVPHVPRRHPEGPVRRGRR